MKWGLVFMALLASGLVSAKQTYGTVSPSVIRSIYDGDTFKVTISEWPAIVGNKISVRVNGVDTPEMRGQCDREIKLARKAKKHTVAFLRSGEKVELRNVQRGKYFRIVADVYVSGENLAESLIVAGLGYRYYGGKKQSWCGL
ncbi:thermonuclease family protein [Candidatus Vondammii sp. HM_W22]|uniref:thermonuclease family protein n=1 Tax=Candidatus Vondammii sp. HM_W22 TaxID=2687299 RepID=UPI002E7B05B1|nr:thermonuclease family protein [Candidatus Vondammii sp. HM_W22]